MKKLVRVLKYEVVIKNDQPELVATETNEIISFDFPLKDGKVDLSVIPNERVSLLFKVDGIFIPYTLSAPKFILS